jgi:hypothetical protein
LQIFFFFENVKIESFFYWLCKTGMFREVSVFFGRCGTIMENLLIVEVLWNSWTWNCLKFKKKMKYPAPPSRFAGSPIRWLKNVLNI